MDRPWRIQMFGGLRAVRGDRVIDRLRKHKAGALLAYLALQCDRSHTREVLIKLLWPDSEPGVIAIGQRVERPRLTASRGKQICRMAKSSLIYPLLEDFDIGVRV